MTRIISIWRPYERLVNTNSVYKAGKNLVFKGKIFRFLYFVQRFYV